MRRVGSVKLRVDESGGEGNKGVTGTGSKFLGGHRLGRAIRRGISGAGP